MLDPRRPSSGELDEHAPRNVSGNDRRVRLELELHGANARPGGSAARAENPGNATRKATNRIRAQRRLGTETLRPPNLLVSETSLMLIRRSGAGSAELSLPEGAARPRTELLAHARVESH